MNRITRTIFIPIVLASLSACAHFGGGTRFTAPSDLPLNAGVKDLSFLTDMEKEVLLYLNDVRTSPERYAAHLKEVGEKPGWPARPESTPPETAGEEGQGMDETILSLQNRQPLPPLKASKGLSLAARDLVQNLGPKGLTGHKASDGSTLFERMDRYGQWEGKTVEILTYGYSDAGALMDAMLADRSPSGREDREGLFNRSYLVAGVSCGPHKTYSTMCAIIFAQEYKEN